MRLIDARYLIKLAAAEGGILRRRQDLPQKAFLTLRQLKRIVDYGGLHVLVVSYPWLQPDHPDPRGETLRLLARVLQVYIDDYRSLAPRGRYRTAGVFLVHPPL